MNSQMAKAILARIHEKKANNSSVGVVPTPVQSNLRGSFLEKTINDYVTQPLAPVASNVMSAGSYLTSFPSNAFGHMSKSVGDYFSRTPLEQRVADMAKQRIDSIGAAEQSDMARRVLLGSLGVGLGAGGLYALFNAMTKPTMPKREDEEMALRYPVERKKVASESIVEMLLGKQQNPSVWDNPLFVPGLALGGLGAVYGGLKGTSYLADKLSEKAKKDELAKAKRDFHEVLISSYDKPLKHDPNRDAEKLSSDNTMTKLSSMLDELYDVCFEKKGLDWTAGGLIPTAIAAALPTYLTIGGIGALGAGSMAYDATRKHSKAEALKKALRERARLKYEQSPPELYISPEAINVRKEPEKSLEEMTPTERKLKKYVKDPFEKYVANPVDKYLVS